MLAEIVRRVAELRPRRPGQALWVLAATRHQTHAIEQALLDAGIATAGVAILTPGQAVRRALAERGIVAPPDVSRSALSAWLLAAAEDLRRREPLLVTGELREILRFAAARHDLLRALLTLRLGEAAYGVRPADLRLAAEGTVLEAFRPLLDAALERSGLHDAAARLAAACQAMSRPHAADPVAIVVCRSGQHEVPELVGLLRALARCPVHVVAPRPAPSDRSGVAGRAGLVFAAEPPASAVAAGNFRVFRTRGDEAELREACRRARALVAAGTPPHRIAILAPRLEPFAPWIAAASAREGLPFTTTAARSLAEETAAALARRLIELVTGDLPRGALCAVLGDPAFAAPAWLTEAGHGSAAAAAGALDYATREAHCLGGATDILASLTGKRSRWPASGMAPLEAYLARLGQCRERLRAAKSASAQAHELEHLLRDGVQGEAGETLAARAAALTQWSSIGLGALSLDRLGAAFDDLVAESTRPVPGQNADGVLVAPLERAHGLDFEHVFLIGLNRDLVPRPFTERPYLPAALVQRWRELAEPARETLPAELRSGQLPLLSTPDERARAAEADLVAMLRGVGRTLTASCQHSSSNGQVRAPSPWLRHLGQAMTGIASLEKLLAAPEWCETAPWSPRDRVEVRLQQGDAWPAGEALLAAAVLGGEATLRAQAATLDATAHAGVAAACDWLVARDSFTPAADGPFDMLSLPATATAERATSVSFVAQLGVCPLRGCFERVLQVVPLPPEPQPESLSRRILGQSVHALLFDLLRDLQQAGHFAAGESLESALRAARGGLEELLRARRPVLLTAQARLLPLLGEHVLDEWQRALARILELDLRECWESGFRPAELEEPIETEVDLESGVRLPLRGKIDRLDRKLVAGRPPRILDYKTGGTFDDPKPLHIEALRGQMLQLPLYVLMLQARDSVGAAEAELRGVAPEHLISDAELPRQPVNPKLFADRQRDGLLETLRVLAGLVAAGSYPFRTGPHCGFCDFQSACPRHHQPARFRLEHLPSLADFRGLTRKNTQRPLLADIHGRQPEDEE